MQLKIYVQDINESYCLSVSKGVKFIVPIKIMAFINTLAATPNSYVSLGTPQPLILSVVSSDHRGVLVTVDKAFLYLNKLCTRIRYFIVIETYTIYCSNRETARIHWYI